MRVTVVLEQLLSPVPGGSGRYAAELAAALARNRSDSDEVASWTARHRDLSPAVVLGIGPPQASRLPPRALAALWARGLGPAPQHADVVHAPTLLVPPRRRGQALVVSIHDAVPWTHPETLTPHGARWHRAMAARAVRSGAAITTLTHAVAEQLQTQLPELDPRRVSVIGAGVSSALRTAPDAATIARVRHKFALREGFVLSLATLEPRKGLDTALAAYGLLGPHVPPLVLAGQPGWGGVEPDSLALDLGIAPGLVRTVGRVSDIELSVLLHEATVLIMPSRAEGFGLPVAEALAAGTAVICSDIPALAEVSGGAAMLVRPDDPAGLAQALSVLLGDAGEQARLAAAGLARSAAFDWDDVATRAWQLYRELA